MPASALLVLQPAVGNAAVVRMLRRAGHAGAQEGRPGEDSRKQHSSVQGVLRAPGRPLDGALRADMESRLGADFSDVRIHDGAAAKASARQVGARAYTSGSHVVVGDGGLDGLTLAHELTHVIQQRQGPVAGADNGAGLRISDPSDRYERATESNARRVMRASGTVQRRETRPDAPPAPSSAAPAVPVVQRWMQSDGSAAMQGNDPTYTADGGRAGTVEVHNLRGTPLMEGFNSPAVSPFGWDALARQGLALGGGMPPDDHYNAVRMHLWNGRLGGAKDQPLNLAPGPAKINSLMSTRAEDRVKDLVLKGDAVWLRTQVTYQSGPADSLDLRTVVPNRISVSWGGGGSAGHERQLECTDPAPGGSAQRPGTADIQHHAGD